MNFHESPEFEIREIKRFYLALLIGNVLRFPTETMVTQQNYACFPIGNQFQTVQERINVRTGNVIGGLTGGFNRDFLRRIIANDSLLFAQHRRIAHNLS